MKDQKVKIWGNGTMSLDLTQISYSMIPSVDLEVGDRAASHTKKDHRRLSAGIREGLEEFFSE
jgi:N-acetylmuramoyl-L-alanine amidase